MVYQPCARVEQMLTVVDDQQHLAWSELVLERVQNGPVVLLAHANSQRGGARDELRVAQRGNIDERGAVRVMVFESVRNLQCEARLADTRGTGQRQESATLEDQLDLADLALPTDEGRELDRQGTAPVGLRRRLTRAGCQQCGALVRREAESVSEPSNGVAVRKIARASL